MSSRRPSTPVKESPSTSMAGIGTEKIREPPSCTVRDLCNGGFQDPASRTSKFEFEILNVGLGCSSTEEASQRDNASQIDSLDAPNILSSTLPNIVADGWNDRGRDQQLFVGHSQGTGDLAALNPASKSTDLNGCLGYDANPDNSSLAPLLEFYSAAAAAAAAALRNQQMASSTPQTPVDSSDAMQIKLFAQTLASRFGGPNNSFAFQDPCAPGFREFIPQQGYPGAAAQRNSIRPKNPVRSEDDLRNPLPRGEGGGFPSRNLRNLEGEQQPALSYPPGWRQQEQLPDYGVSMSVDGAGSDGAGHMSGQSSFATMTTVGGNKKTQYHKTKLCPWHRDGRCFMGENCNYAHSREELKAKPDLSRTKLCPHLMKGRECAKPRCRFAHDFVELRATSAFYKTRICKFWQRGFCPAGEECRHAHGADDLRSVDVQRDGESTLDEPLESRAGDFDDRDPPPTARFTEKVSPPQNATKETDGRSWCAGGKLVPAPITSAATEKRGGALHDCHDLLSRVLSTQYEDQDRNEPESNYRVSNSPCKTAGWEFQPDEDMFLSEAAASQAIGKLLFSAGHALDPPGGVPSSSVFSTTANTPDLRASSKTCGEHVTGPHKRRDASPEPLSPNAKVLALLSDFIVSAASNPSMSPSGALNPMSHPQRPNAWQLDNQNSKQKSVNDTVSLQKSEIPWNILKSLITTSEQDDLRGTSPGCSPAKDPRSENLSSFSSSGAEGRTVNERSHDSWLLGGPTFWARDRLNGIPATYEDAIRADMMLKTSPHNGGRAPNGVRGHVRDLQPSRSRHREGMWGPPGSPAGLRPTSVDAETLTMSGDAFGGADPAVLVTGWSPSKNMTLAEDPQRNHDDADDVMACHMRPISSFGNIFSKGVQQSRSRADPGDGTRLPYGSPPDPKVLSSFSVPAEAHWARAVDLAVQESAVFGRAGSKDPARRLPSGVSSTSPGFACDVDYFGRGEQFLLSADLCAGLSSGCSPKTFSPRRRSSARKCF